MRRNVLGSKSLGVCWSLVVLGCVSLAGVVLRGDEAAGPDAFYEVALDKLKVTEGTIPEDFTPSSGRFWRRTEVLRPRVVIEGEGEAYLPTQSFTRPVPVRPDGTEAAAPHWRTLAIRAPKGKPVRGTLYLPKSDATGSTVVKFTLPDERSPDGKATDAARKNFYLAREDHYDSLARAGRPGSAWFRYQALESRRVLDGKKAIDDVLTEQQQPQNRPERTTGIEETYDLFSGGRAISENLQLDRLLRPTKANPEPVAIDTLKGITVAEMDWKALTKDIQPPLDPLAALIPSDQHALFFPTFQALVTTMDEADAQGTPVLDLIQERAEDLDTRHTYQRQLCLEVSAVSRLLGDQVVRSVAFTGGDPYLRTGTDVAVLFETNAPRVLTEFLATKHAAALKANAGCKEVKGKLAGTDYQGVVTPTRTISSYRATVGNAVIVTNSLKQLERLIATAAGKETPLATLPEYRFFRNRYSRTNPDESAFLVLTDATIRRWCGPKWRIGASRRTRAAAVMMQLQAGHFPELVAGEAKAQQLPSALFVPDIGSLELTPEGVISSTYGSLEFETPINELDLTTVTKDEAESYERWRDGYQSNWRGFFDPIAVSFSIREKRLGADVTVMPLIAASEYRDEMNIVGKAKIAPDAGDRHQGTLFHWIMAIDPKSPPLQRAGGFLEAMVKTAGGGPFSWLGSSIAVYADPDPFWLDLAKAEADKHEEFLTQNIHRLPIAFRAEVASPLKLAAFLTAIRGFVEQSAPNLSTWESKKHNDQAYVSVRPTAAARRGTPVDEKLALYYAPTPTSLLLTLNEDLLKRAIDREVAAQKAESEKKPASDNKASETKPDDKKPGETKPAGDTGKPWLGESMALQLDSGTIEMLSKLGSSEYQQTMQLRAWANLPILNEWKRRFPKEDPVALNAKYWQATLRCPGGGKYVWNDEYQTMESTIYGHPGQPKEGPAAPAPLRQVKSANFGVTFESQGLRARAELDRSKP